MLKIEMERIFTEENLNKIINHDEFIKDLELIEGTKLLEKMNSFDANEFESEFIAKNFNDTTDMILFFVNKIYEFEQNTFNEIIQNSYTQDELEKYIDYFNYSLRMPDKKFDSMIMELEHILNYKLNHSKIKEMNNRFLKSYKENLIKCLLQLKERSIDRLLELGFVQVNSTFYNFELGIMAYEEVIGCGECDFCEAEENGGNCTSCHTYYKFIKGTKIINLTPHTVNYINGSKTIKFESKGIARCRQINKLSGIIMGMTITKTEFGEIYDLPEEKEGIKYIVSRIVLEACKDNRKDLLVPNEIVRDDDGVIIGCKSFSIN